ncbi:3-carboxy-cis,cis-muconate cycloisomerase [Mumia flava]|uniref:3-carboxy-cis,cis-muconate cycloisomerase n=1 Tax=Mumia flava TaxID=1348852 RepID=A0A0B2B7Y3_9ACTN|nr:lyase family protein [Mumia flava]PJJ57543.1 3-carboxy-cis,cis-muconate cycloisomerase [Mumia flava]
MGDLLWPGDERAGDLASDDAFLAAMVRVEQAWLDALHGAGVAPTSTDLLGLVGLADADALASAAEAGGNPVIPLVRTMRERLSERGDEQAARWLHRGLTSQDVVDTGLVLALGDAADAVLDEMAAQARALLGLVERHRASAMTARTLTQHAVPTTFGLLAATWLTGVLDAADDLRRVRSALPIAFGGAGGTMSAATTLVRDAAVGARPVHAPPADRAALELVARCARALGLAVPTAPWHVVRSPLTRLGDALVTCSDAWGHIASDVLALGRPEIGEVAEPAADGKGGSSTMPNKRNPVLSVLIRRAAIAAPPLASTLHTAATLAVDQRSDGAWHAEWGTARTLARRALVAASHTTELLAGLEVDPRRMRERLEGVGAEVTAERRSMAALVGNAPAADSPDLILPDDLGAADAIVDVVLARARTSLEITG